MPKQYPSIVDAIAPALSQYLNNAQQREDMKRKNARQEFEDKLRLRQEQIASENSMMNMRERLFKDFTTESVSRALESGSPGTQRGMIFPNLESLVRREDPKIARNREWVQNNLGALPDFLKPYAGSGQLSPGDLLDSVMEERKQAALERYRNAKLHGKAGPLGNLSTFEQKQLVESSLLGNPQYRSTRAIVDRLGKQLDEKRRALDKNRADATWSKQIREALPQQEAEYSKLLDEYKSVKSGVDSIATDAWAKMFAPQFVQPPAQSDSTLNGLTDQDIEELLQALE